MSQELEDEITSINSIYGENTLVRVSTGSPVYALTFSRLQIIVRIEFPLEYPDVPPSVLGTQSIGDNVPRGEGSHLVELIRVVLSELYSPGSPCIFDLIEEVDVWLEQLGLDQSSENEERLLAQTDEQIPASSAGVNGSSDGHQQPQDLLGEEPAWTLSEAITEKKSVFVARSVPVTSIEQTKQYLAHLIASDKKVAKASHNITAWRIRGENGVQYQDCDDDGETAAGGRVLHLLELMNIWDVMVIVTRWYGGVHLGPDRFRIINQTARDALVRGGFAENTEKDGGKKKGKR